MVQDKKNFSSDKKSMDSSAKVQDKKGLTQNADSRSSIKGQSNTALNSSKDKADISSKRK